MIPRTLVPTDVRPVKPEELRKNGARRTTYMDDRTVVPSELSDAPPLTGATTIPEHLPLGVLVDRTLVERGMKVKVFEDFGPINERQYPIDVLDTRVVVPAYVERPEQAEIDKFDKPPEMTAQLREMVGTDVLTTGEANLLVEPEEKRDAKADAFTRVASIIAHIAFIIFLIFLPKIFPPHIPTVEETELASKELGIVYVPPDAGDLTKAPKPAEPPPKINKKTLTKVAPPRPENHMPPPETREAPAATAPSDLPSAPTPRPSTAPPAAVNAQPDPTPTKSELLPAEPKAQPNRKLDLGLNNTSPGRAMQNDLNDAIKRAPGGPSYQEEGQAPSGRGGGGGGHGGVQAGAGAAIISPTDGVDFDSYLRRLVAKVRQNWIAVMPESVYLGDQGVVAITFRINSDGSFPPESLNLDRSSGKDPLDTAAMAAIRSSSPFEPLPPQFKRPYIELRFGFYYNVKPPSYAQ
ncbi:MAG: TonB family protein [Candidatus Acidiferrales bacterium]|jgi:TonB family protein